MDFSRFFSFWMFCVGLLVLSCAGCKPSADKNDRTHGEEMAKTNALQTQKSELKNAQVKTNEPDFRGAGIPGSRGATVVETPAARKSPEPYQQVFVVCVGINQNPAYGPLQYAVNDATDVAAIAREKFGFTNVTVLTDTNATKQNITHAIENVRAKLSPGGKDDFIFLYAGHGDTVPEPVSTNDGTNTRQHGFLITYHEANERPKSLEEMRSRYLEMTALAQQVQELPARHRLMFLDSCFSGLAFVQRESINNQPQEIYEDVIASPTVQIMTAGLDTEEAREDSKSRHGVFTAALLEQLRGDDVRTMEEIFFPLRVSVRKNLAEMGKPMSMTPQHRYLLYTNGTFVFVPVLRRENWAAIRPTNSVILAAAREGYFRPVTREEVTNLNMTATAKGDQWQSEVDRYEARAAMGDANAAIALSQIYGEGIGVPANPNRARIYHNESSDFISASGKLNVAAMLGITDPAKAALVNKIIHIESSGRGRNPFNVPTTIRGKIPSGTIIDLLKKNSSSNQTDIPPTETPQKKSPFEIPNPFKRAEGTLTIPFQGQSIEIAVPQKIRPSKEAKAGMAALQVGDLPTAISEFTTAVKNKPDSEHYHFALAVAMEASGDYVGAREHYVQANRLKGGKGNLAAQEGVKRINARGK